MWCNTKTAWLGVCLILLLTSACKKDAPVISQKMTFQVEHFSALQQLAEDTIQYQNAAGNTYSVTRLEYYISNVRFVSDDGDTSAFDAIHYVNPLRQIGESWEVEIPEGNYRSLSFNIGLTPEKNVSYSLAPTAENINMAWPDVMGGGYHFMKFEGHYLDDQSEKNGFAMHLGMNMWLVEVTIPISLSIVSNPITVTLSMDVNEWFDHPHIYDFNKQGNYTMGVDSLMQKLAENGRNVFVFSQNP